LDEQTPCPKSLREECHRLHLNQHQLHNTLNKLHRVTETNKPKERALQRAMFGALITAHDNATQNNIPLKPHEYIAPSPTDNPALKSYVHQPIPKAAFKTKRHSETTPMGLTNRLSAKPLNTVQAVRLEDSH